MAKFLIVEARFYDHLNDMLIAGARAAIALADGSGDYDGYVAIGVVIRGETYHFEIVAGESARGIMALTMDGVAIGNGILTVENEAQAIVRADPQQKDKGGEAAKAAIALLGLKEKFGG
jgi:6,7-dimethyl-8-ribityllumazine synthase